MPAWNAVWAVARAELRAARRLVRYWVFLALAWLVGVAGFLYYSVFLHRGLSGFSATIAQVGGRYFVAIYGGFYILVFLAGVVFLAFDLRTKDERARIAEVLDARPQSNLEFVGGRYVGLLLASWFPLIGVAAVIQVIGWSAGEPVEPFSLLEFVFFMSLPALSLGIGLTYLASVLLRSRILVAVVVLGLLTGAIFGGNYLPVYLSPLVNIQGGFALGYPSDLVHFDNLGQGLLQRFGMLLLGLGLVGLAAALYPRHEARGRAAKLWGALAVLAAGAASLYAVVHAQRSLVESARIAREHHAAQREVPAPDLERLEARVALDPGSQLELEATLQFRAPEKAPLDRVLWSLNPGLEVETVTDAGGQALSFHHEAGLLEVSLPAPLAAGQTSTLRVRARGEPDRFYGYLDAARHVFAESSREAQLFVLGYATSIFDRRFVALMPASRWLPASGTDLDRDDPRRRRRDFFQLELEVELPEGWLPACAGRREELPTTTEGRRRFRFAPEAPLPEAALVAAPFASRRAEVEGVEFEALLHPAHEAQLEFFEDAAGEIGHWLAEKLQEARALGLDYPYGALRFVEVPNSLRAYAGGWRMGSALTAPGLLLVRESSFPTARFDVQFRDPQRFTEQEGGVARAKRESLERFFETDFTGGNVFLNGARNFFDYLTAPYGEGALPFEHVLGDLTNRLVTGKRGYFSVHVFGPELNRVVQSVMFQWFLMQGSPGERNFVDAVVRAIVSRPSVWDTLVETPLARLDPWEDPRTALDVLVLKGDAMAESLLDRLGREGAGSLLAELRRKYAGRTFDRGAVEEALRENAPGLEAWLAVWLDRKELPAFVAERVERYRLPDTPEGQPRYQLRLVLRNEAEVEGLLRVEYEEDLGDNESRHQTSDPLLVPGRSRLEFATVTSRPVKRLLVRPYLSLNRGPFEVQLPPLDAERTIEREPTQLTRILPWEPRAAGVIVADDLDPGFRAVEPERRGWLRLGGRGTRGETDQGLPVAFPAFFRVPERWSRAETPSAWGRYRHTFAFVRGDDPERQAVFETELPQGGPWALELHLPEIAARSLRKGTWAIEVRDGEAHSASFDLSAAHAGWNSVGSFTLPAGKVSVVLRPGTDARALVADAIRWRAAESAEDTAGAQAE